MPFKLPVGRFFKCNTLFASLIFIVLFALSTLTRLHQQLLTIADVDSHEAGGDELLSDLPVTSSNPDDDFQHQHRPDQKGMVGCLLIKDSNHRLSEWIAYHYHVLPLRFLIVAIDPESETSPKHILSHWNRTELGLRIVAWENDVFVRSKMVAKPDDNVTADERELRLHQRYWLRQQWFMSQCLATAKREHLTWTYLGDVDEYLLFNYYQKGETLGGNVTSQDVQMFESRKNLPSVETGTILHYIEERKEFFPWNELCVRVPRLRYGPRESKSARIHKQIPTKNNGDIPVVDPTLFDTMRFRYHAKRGTLEDNKFVKSLMDASRMPDEFLGRRTQNPHQPYPLLCNFMSYCRRCYQLDPLIINHYSGSLESYMYGRMWKQDRFNVTSKGARRFYSDDIRPWLKGFFALHGEENATSLLQHVGIIE